jgi:DNA replication licensing factor MCM5
MVLPDYSDFIDFQILKIQESPENIPTGEVPRTYPICCEKHLVDKLVPGTKLTITGIYTLIERKLSFGNSNTQGLRMPYIICMGKLPLKTQVLKATQTEPEK